MFVFVFAFAFAFAFVFSVQTVSLQLVVCCRAPVSLLFEIAHHLTPCPMVNNLGVDVFGFECVCVQRARVRIGG